MNLFQRYLASEFAEDYEEGRLSRREALKLIASVTGSLIAAEPEMPVILSTAVDVIGRALLFRNALTRFARLCRKDWVR